jgi:RNA polymerase sigma-70 factor (ECF subfamily)
VLVDDALVARVQAGDAEAYSAIFLSCYASLVRFAYRYVHIQADAEEVVQDIMVRVWEQRATLPDAVNLKTYLYSAVRNRAIDVLRQRQRILRFEEHVAGDEVVPAMGQPADAIEDVLAAEDLTLCVSRVVTRLPVRCRQVFLLHRLHHLTHAEIAEAMGISPKTVQVQMGRALKALRRCRESSGGP